MNYQLVGMTVGFIALGSLFYLLAVAGDDDYVPFQISSTIHPMASEICDDAGNITGDQHQIRIDGGSDFMVTGVTFQPTGVDEATDSIVIGAIYLDSQALYANTGDLTGIFPTSRGFDIAGVSTISGGNMPTSIVALVILWIVVVFLTAVRIVGRFISRKIKKS